MSKFRKYSEYKEVKNYIGSIPSEWEIDKLKVILQERNKKNKPIISKERLSLSIDKGVTLYAEKTTNLDRFKNDFSQYKIAYPKDLVINSMNVIVGAAGISKYFGCVSPAYYVLYSSDETKYLADYFYYFFKTSKMQKKLYSIGRGIMAIDRGNDRVNTCRLKVAKNDLKSLIFPIPSIKEQHKIVDFIKFKENQINKLINKQKKLIELLEEKKLIIISNNVLNKFANIENDYISRPLKYCFDSNISGNWGNNESHNNSDQICIRIADFDYKKMKIKTNIDYTKRNYDFKIFNKIRLINGDILIEKSGGGEKTPVGRTVLFDLDIDATFANFMNRLRVSAEINPKFMQYFLFAIYNNKKIVKYIKQTTGIQNLDLSMMLRDINVILPPKEVQNKIVDKLDEICDEINNCNDKRAQLINKLEEYKKTLISNAVTGQIDVRDYEIPATNDNIDLEEFENISEDDKETLNEVEYANN